MRLRPRAGALLRVAAALASASIACGADPAASAGRLPAGIATRAEDLRGEMRVGGRSRSWLLHRPPGHDPRVAAPLVVVLHGGGGNGAGMARISGFSAAADDHGFLVVYPDGTGPLDDRLLTWNAGNCCGWALEHEIDDVEFLAALLDRLASDVAIDPARVYVTGFSNGAMMAYRAACELPDRVAAIAPVAGAMNIDSCAPAPPVSVAIFHGTADEHVLFEGGAPIRLFDRRHPRIDAPVSRATSFWSERNGCGPEPEVARRGAVTVETWEGCEAGTGVALHAIEGGGHAWPGGAKGTPWGDEPTEEIDATAAMWAFFEDHPRE